MAQFLEGSVTLEELQGTRCRLQRLRDSKLFSGWVRSAGNEQISVELKDAVPSEAGEAFNLEATTGEFNVAYPCLLIAADGRVLRLSITGQPLISTPGQEARYRAPDIRISLLRSNASVQAEAIDVSASGIGLVTTEPLNRFEVVKLTLRDNSVTVVCEGGVRYCRPDPSNKGDFRIGILLNLENRLTRAMWMRMVQTASQGVEKAA